MICSLNCYCEFLQAKTSATRDSIVRKYKKIASAESKGRSVYYRPAKRALTGKLCPGGSIDEKIQAIREECIVPAWTDKLNDARIANNVRVFRVVRSILGNREISALPNPRMQFLASSEVAINMQSDLFFESENGLTMILLGLKKKCWPDDTIKKIIQMLYKATQHKGLNISIARILYLETGAEKLHCEPTVNTGLIKDLASVTEDLLRRWEAKSV